MVSDAPAFFSYCREDSDFALRLAEDLKAAGASVWMDQLDIVPGLRWDRAVEDALASCPRLLVILSPSSVNSTNVMDEVSFALDEEKTVIPVVYQDCTVPFRLRRVQYVDFRHDYARGLRELLKTLAPAGTAQVSRSAPGVARRRRSDLNEAKQSAPQEDRRTTKEQRKEETKEEERRQAAERARLEERKTADEKIREAELERQRLEEQRQRLAREETVTVVSAKVSRPATIGKYTIESVLGRGGMGVVYKAVDPQIGRYVAIKMILSQGDPSLLERFRSEARSTGSLQCPNIVTVYDFGEHEGNPYLVMQFLEGSSLESMIQKGLQLTLSEKLGIIIDVCNGLAYAHQRGVIHRDIKPANIMVLQDGVNDGMAVIVDFGIARIGGAARLTKTDQIVGSVHYMSAEQLQSLELDNRTDIYATGVVLFQLLTGALPFDAPDTAATLLKIINEPPPPLSNYLREYPIELEAIVSRVLAKKREDRYPSAKELAFDLMQVQERLKSETIVQFVGRAETALAREEWTRAREQLQHVLRIDRQNTRALKLMNEVQEHLRQQQHIEQARVLRGQADEAYMDQRYDDALRLLDRAVMLDPKNSDLQALRESVRLSKERTAGLRDALRRAEAALQDGDLDEAQGAINEAFQIDPYDTQAKALKLIISQHVEEKARQRRLRELLDQARTEITTRDLAAAFETLKAAEVLDPASHELKTLARMAVSAREQEKRRAATEELRQQVETALLHEDYTTAATIAAEGLRKFPQEQSLSKLKTLAEAQKARAELKKFVREQVANANSLADSGQLQQAVTILDQALQRLPGNTELETLRSNIQDRIAAEAADEQKLQALESALAEAKRILEEEGAESARAFLDVHSAPYIELPQVREVYETVRTREAVELLGRKLAGETDPAKRVELAEEAARSDPDNGGLKQRLAELQKILAQIQAGTQRAEGLERKGRYADAIREWQQLNRAYPQVPEFQMQAQRLAGLEEAERTKPLMPVVGPAVTPEPGVTEELAAVTHHEPAEPPPETEMPSEAPSDQVPQEPSEHGAVEPSAVSPLESTYESRLAVTEGPARRIPITVWTAGAIGLLAVVILAAVFRPHPPTPILSPGYVALNPLPWAEVVAIKNKADNKTVANASGQTPMRVALPPGDYLIDLKGPSGAQEISVTVESGKNMLRTDTLTGFDVDKVVDELLKEK